VKQDVWFEISSFVSAFGEFSSFPVRSLPMTATAWKKDRQPEKASSSALPTQDPRAEDFMSPFASIKDDAIDSGIIASLVASMADGKSSG
jgi:hypothetical protein